MDTQSKSAANLILASLAEPDDKKISTRLEPVTLSMGQILYQADQQIDYVYFPENAIISVMQTTKNKKSVEVGLIGREGMAGISLISGLSQSPYQAVVQVAGEAMRMEAVAFINEFNRLRALHSLILRYLHGFVMHIAYTAVCNRFHLLEQRLARWLLMIQDRIQTNALYLTHEFIATIMGVGRVPVTLTAGTLQKSGLIQYRRGEITIINREGLESLACECYTQTKAEFGKVRLEL